MNKLESQWKCLEGQTCGVFELGKIWYYKSGEKVMLVDPLHGGTIILSEDLFAELAEGRPSDDLLFKLAARGFASTDGAPGVREQEDSAPKPTFFMLDMTSKCNFKCEYCLREIEGNDESISMEQLDKNLDKLIEYAQDYGLTGLTIQPWGGEPMIEFDKILHIRERFDKTDIPLALTMETNGSLLTQEKAEALKKVDVKIGVSMDGTPEIHDHYRHLQGGQNTFALAQKGLENLRRSGFKTIGGIGVVTKQTLAHLEEVLDYYVKELRLTGFKLTIMHSPADHALCKEMLDEKEIEEYAERLVDRFCTYYRQGYTSAESSISNRMANLIYRSRSNICVSNGCRGGRRLLSIDKHGTIFLCELMDQPAQAIGHVSEARSIPEMVERAMKEKDYFNEKRIPQCEECPWWYYCRGGCTAIVIYEKGYTEGVDPISCRFNRTVYPRLAKIMMDDPELALKFI